MNWGDNVPGASTLLAKRLVRSISGQNFDLLVYAAGATLVVVDVRTAARCLQRRYCVFPASVDSRRGRRIECEQPHTDTIRDLVYNPELQLLLSGGDDKRWACWDVPSMRVRAQVRICGSPARYTRSFAQSRASAKRRTELLFTRPSRGGARRRRRGGRLSPSASAPTAGPLPFSNHRARAHCAGMARARTRMAPALSRARTQAYAAASTSSTLRM